MGENMKVWINDILKIGIGVTLGGIIFSILLLLLVLLIEKSSFLFSVEQYLIGLKISILLALGLALFSSIFVLASRFLLKND